MRNSQMHGALNAVMATRDRAGKVIDTAYVDAAAALVAAELIDEANAEAVAAMLAEAWVHDGEDDA